MTTSNPAFPPADQVARPSVEVAIAIIFENAALNPKLLICRRKADAVLGGYWEFPGGKCNPREAPQACAIREAEEETGLHITILRPLAVLEHDYPHAKVRLHPFLCRHAKGELELKAVAEARWIEASDVQNFRFPEANTPLLEHIRMGLEAMLSVGDVQNSSSSI